MNMNTLLDYSSFTDRRLVELHLDGDRTAFRQIVERHQAMVCALGLSACGDVARSEDIAQEVFVAAWKQLPALREPEKLRGWLAGIARNLINNSFRRQQRTPTARAEPLSAETLADADSPREHAISSEEAALMWSTLEGIPENYREPMVLFYREQRSTAAVAAALEISEEAVRQRLARGRAMLTERLAKLVEETLERSAPTPAFAGAVILALPVMGSVMVETVAGTSGAAAKTMATAGAMGGAAAKGGLAIKLLAAAAALPTLLTGVTDYLRFRAHYEAPSAGGRREVIATHVLPLLMNAAVLGSFAFIIWVPVPSAWKPLAMIPFVAALLVSAIFERRRQRALTASGGTQPVRPAFEYCSRGGWLGLPWIHIIAGGRLRRRKAAGWIAVSDGAAIGGLFASAPLAVAPVSVGGVAVGLLALGGLALGVGALGVTAGGGWATGGLAFASHAAQGGLAFAPDYAAGGWALAKHANDAVAMDCMRQHLFFRFTDAAWRVAAWAAFFGWLLPLLLIGWHLWRTRAQR